MASAYVLPVAAATTMVHTVSGIVLHRLWRMQEASDTPSEARAPSSARWWIASARSIRSSSIASELHHSRNCPSGGHRSTLLRLEHPDQAEAENQHPRIRRAAGRQHLAADRLFSHRLPLSARVLAESYRAVVGLTEAPGPDGEALDRMLNPARNTYRLETLNVGVHAPLMRPLQHANFTFAKRISHTADSQDQRHRMVPGSRPLLVLTDTRSPDFVTPTLIRGNPRATEVYQQAMHDAWAAKNELLDRGVPAEFALYLLPNAKVIRLVESGSLLHLLHKWTMRTCFNAQEEIYEASMQEVAQVREALPSLARYIGPPCYIRAGVATPICTEGSHFCGIKVWEQFPNIERRL